MELINVTIKDGIGLVTISRPKALNALNNQVFEELDACMGQLRHNSDVGAVIITGDGPKSFVAGADIKELAELNTLTAQKLSARGQRVFRDIEQFPKPVIAAVNGFALGGGCELALACHMRIASDNAKLGLPEVSLGLIPGYGGTQRLARIVGKGLAMEMVLSGDFIDAARAQAIGLVNRVVAADELLDEARKLAGKIMSRGPRAVAFAIQAINDGMEVSQTEGERMESALFGLVFGSEDAHEGMAAFIEKRKAQFKGH